MDRHAPNNKPDSVRLHDMSEEIEANRGDESRHSFIRKCIRYALDHMPASELKKGRKS